MRCVRCQPQCPSSRLSRSSAASSTVPAGDRRLLVHFGDYADADTPYMFHCHILQHEDRGMMGQFVVVDRAETS
jgi:suppressor of ftsI